MYAPNQPPPGYQKPAQGAPQAPRKSNLELIMEIFVASQTQQNKEFINQNVHTSELVKQIATKVDALATHNKMLETQISQVAHNKQLPQPQLEPVNHNLTRRVKLMLSYCEVGRS